MENLQKERDKARNELFKSLNSSQRELFNHFEELEFKIKWKQKK